MYRKSTLNKLRQEKEGYTIGEVSYIVNLSQKTLRDYEKAGLIKPKREPRTNNRIYSEFEIEQIKHILHLIHNEGFTLPCIKRILQLAPCWNVFDCEVKEKCPAYTNPHTPCYETRVEVGTLCSGDCKHCGIYLNRRENKTKILSRPANVSKITS